MNSAKVIAKLGWWFRLCLHTTIDGVWRVKGVFSRSRKDIDQLVMEFNPDEWNIVWSYRISHAQWMVGSEGVLRTRDQEFKAP